MLLVAILAYLTVAQADIDFVKVNRLAHPDIIPSSWQEGMEHRPVGKVEGAVSTYLVINAYMGSSTCDGSVKTSSGTGFNVCTPTSNTTSTMYSTSSKAGYYALNMFTTADCSGTPTTYDSPVPSTCLQSGSNGYRYSVVNSGAPWKDLKTEGLVSEIYPLAEDCDGSGSGSVYSWISTDYCQVSTSMSLKYTSCAGDKVSWTVYNDLGCANAANSSTVSTYSCHGGTTSYVSTVCSAAN